MPSAFPVAAPAPTTGSATAPTPTVKKPSTREKALVSIVLKTHLSDGLKDLYREEEDPDKLWTRLDAKFKETIASQKVTIRREWEEFGMDQFTSINDFEVAMYRLEKMMALCGYKTMVTEDEKINKTIETLGEGQDALQTTLRARKFTSFDLLIHELREQLAKSQIARSRAQRRLATTTMEANATSVRPNSAAKRAAGAPYDKTKRGGSHKGKKNGRGGDMRRLKCFACGQKGHMAGACKASAAEKAAYQASRPPRKDQEAHAMEIGYGLEDELMVETHMTVTGGMERMDIDGDDAGEAMAVDGEACV